MQKNMEIRIRWMIELDLNTIPVHFYHLLKICCKSSKHLEKAHTYITYRKLVRFKTILKTCKIQNYS